jgi:uncharacterized protein
MDGFSLAVFLLAAFLGGFASGLAGFAMGFIVSAFWLHLLTPIETTALIVRCSFWTQGYGVWKLRRSIDWRLVAPFILAGTAGVPIGAALLAHADPAILRAGVGVLLAVYGGQGLLQPKFTPVRAGTAADVAVGALNGVLCGMTGLPGFVITVWAQMRGWAKDAQRAVFQPVMLAASLATGVALAAGGALTARMAELYLFALPALLAGLWLGFALYGKLDDAAFRKLLLWMLLASGLALVLPFAGSQVFPWR